MWLVDEGVASGCTMPAAAEWVRRHAPRSLRQAVPVSQGCALELLCPLFDTVHCLTRKGATPFAVASSYLSFPEVSGDEVCPAPDQCRL